MKTRKSMMNCTIGFCIVLSALVIVFSPSNVLAQFGNTISGNVFGAQRQPVNDVTVELLDEFSRSVARTRTNSGGRFIFSRLSSGRFRIRVLSLGTDYEEQEQEVEIQNISRELRGGGVLTSGYENVQRDFYLKPRRGSQITGRSESIFVQEIPEQAKATYKKAIELLDKKKDEQGLKDLKSAIEIFPNYYDALERLGTEYIKLQHYVPAQILLLKAVEVNPRGYKSWYGLAYALYSLNKTNEAIEAVEKAASLNQFSIEAPFLNGVLLRRAGRYKESEKQLKRAKELANGAIPEIHWHLALLYGNNLKRYADAAEELELFLKKRPDSKDADNIKKLIKQFKEKAQKS